MTPFYKFILSLNRLKMKTHEAVNEYLVDLIIKAAKILDKSQMIRFDTTVNSFHPTQLGRIACNYYVSQATIDLFNYGLKQITNEYNVLSLLCQSSEFTQIRYRDDETEELMRLYSNFCFYKPSDFALDNETKIEILIQSAISKYFFMIPLSVLKILS